MKKPEKKYPVEKCYDYYDVISYIEKKFGYNTGDFDNYWGSDKTKPKGKEYQDFWGWMIEDGEVHNGGIIHIPFYGLYDEKEDYPDWVIKILTDIRNEFDPEQKEDGLECWVSW